MRRVAALYDIHGNLPALDAVLSALHPHGVDAIVFGGDLALGPMPRETLERLLDLKQHARFIQGNCDRLIVDAFDGRPLPPLPAAIAETIRWSARQLSVQHRDFLAGFPGTLSIPVQRLGDVLFCHASPRSDDEIFTSVSPSERIRPMLGRVTQRIVICGHTHMQFDREVDGIRIVNAGSVGMPYGAPGAYWLLMGPAVQLMRTEYDFEAGAAEVRRTAFPLAESFAAVNVLAPPSEQEMLRALEPPIPSA